MSFLLLFAGGFAGYVVTSFIFLRYPRLIHKRKSASINAVHISHRGGLNLKMTIFMYNKINLSFEKFIGAGERIENTLEAFSKYDVFCQQ